MPSYTPTTFTDTITFRLGRVNLGSATNGSAAIPSPGFGFAASDVGCPAMVFAAGPAGAPLITTVAAVTDADNATMADTASSDATDVTVIVWRPVACKKDSINFNSSLTSFGTGKATILSDQATWFGVNDLTGMPVLVEDQDPEFGLVYLFGGAVNQSDAKTEPGTGKCWYDLLLVSYDYLARKRTTGELTLLTSPVDTGQPLNGNWVNSPAGDIFAYLTANALDGDGMGSLTVAGPNIDFGTRFEYVADAYDRICTLASSGTDKYFWYIDPWRVAVFAKQSTHTAPWNIDEGDGSDGNVLALVTCTRSLQSYANRAINDLPQSIGESGTETYSGDGTTQQFGLLQNVAALPAITVDLGSGPVVQTVGVLNSDTGKDWYFSLGSNIITQDSGGTPLGVTDAIAITYQGYVAAVILRSNTTGIDERAGREGGTGYHERVITSNTPQTSSDGAALAQAIADAYGVVPSRVGIQTYRGGLSAGQYQTVNLAGIGASGSFLIDSVNFTTESNRKKWTVTAIDGALIGDWRTILGGSQHGASGGTGASASGGSSGSTSAILKVVVTAPATVTPPASPSDGAMLVVKITQDATGYAVTWDSSFLDAPDVPTDPNTKTIVTFTGIDGSWELSAVPVLGAKA